MAYHFDRTTRNSSNIGKWLKAGCVAVCPDSSYASVVYICLHTHTHTYRDMYRYIDGYVYTYIFRSRALSLSLSLSLSLYLSFSLSIHLGGHQNHSFGGGLFPQE